MTKDEGNEDPTMTTEAEDEYSDNEATPPTIPEGDKRVVEIGEEMLGLHEI